MPVEQIVIMPVPRYKRDNYNNIRAFVQFVLVGDFGSFCVRGARIFIDPKGNRRLFFPEEPARIICPMCKVKVPYQHQYCGSCATCIADRREGPPDIKSKSFVFPINADTRKFIETLVINLYDTLYDDDGNELKNRS